MVHREGAAVAARRGPPRRASRPPRCRAGARRCRRSRRRGSRAAGSSPTKSPSLRCSSAYDPDDVALNCAAGSQRLPPVDVTGGLAAEGAGAEPAERRSRRRSRSHRGRLRPAERAALPGGQRGEDRSGHADASQGSQARAERRRQRARAENHQKQPERGQRPGQRRGSARRFRPTRRPGPRKSPNPGPQPGAQRIEELTPPSLRLCARRPGIRRRAAWVDPPPMSTDPEVGRSGRAARLLAAGKPDRKAGVQDAGRHRRRGAAHPLRGGQQPEGRGRLPGPRRRTRRSWSRWSSRCCSGSPGKPHAAPDAPRARRRRADRVPDGDGAGAHDPAEHPEADVVAPAQVGQRAQRWAGRRPPPSARPAGAS